MEKIGHNVRKSNQIYIVLKTEKKLKTRGNKIEQNKYI